MSRLSSFANPMLWLGLPSTHRAAHRWPAEGEAVDRALEVQTSAANDLRVPGRQGPRP